MKFSRVPVLFRWMLAVLWTLLVGYLLLWPAEGTTVEDVSDTFGGSDLTDSLGHIAMLFVETALLYSLACYYMPPPLALRMAAGGTLVLGTILECAQHWIPERGFALYDLGANWFAVGMFVWAFKRLIPIYRRIGTNQ